MNECNHGRLKEICWQCYDEMLQQERAINKQLKIRAEAAERERDEANQRWLDRLAEIDQLRAERDRLAARLRSALGENK